MNKKGFTLVELLAVIVILAVVMLIGSVSVAGVKNKINQNMFETKLELAIGAAKSWGQDNKESLPTDTTIKTLIDEKYYETDDGDIIDDNTGTSVKDLKIHVYKKNNRVYACISNTSFNWNLLGDDSSHKKYGHLNYYCS